METSSPEYRRFVDSFQDSGTTRERHESFDLGALLALRGTERESAEKMLIVRLACRQEDPRVPAAMTALGPSTETLSALRSALDRYPKNRTRIAVARALWDLERLPSAVTALLEMAREATRPDRRAAALGALGDIPGDAMDEALLAAAGRDPEATVRMVAVSTLCERHRLESRGQAGDPVAALLARLRGGDAPAREAAAAELRALLPRRPAEPDATAARRWLTPSGQHLIEGEPQSTTYGEDRPQPLIEGAHVYTLVDPATGDVVATFSGHEGRDSDVDITRYAVVGDMLHCVEFRSYEDSCWAVPHVSEVRRSTPVTGLRALEDGDPGQLDAALGLRGRHE